MAVAAGLGALRLKAANASCRSMAYIRPASKTIGSVVRDSSASNRLAISRSTRSIDFGAPPAVRYCAEMSRIIRGRVNSRANAPHPEGTYLLPGGGCRVVTRRFYPDQPVSCKSTRHICRVIFLKYSPPIDKIG